jgi:hypothetical protein
MEDRHVGRRRPRLSKAPSASLAVAIALAVAAGCGDSGKKPASTSQRRVSTAASTVEPPATVDPGKALPMSGYEPPTKLHFLRGDGDRDVASDADGYKTLDNDEDPRLDGSRGDTREGYRDADDLDSLRVGVPASRADAKAIIAAVKRYYAVAVTGNGAKACSLMARAFVRSVVVDYGEFGPSYLHGAKSCTAIAERQFRHARNQLTAAVHVTAVHLEHPDRAYALFGSRTTPASFIAVVREGGAWKVGALMGRPVP